MNTGLLKPNKPLSVMCGILSISSLILSMACYASHRNDMLHLEKITRKYISATDSSEAFELVNSWVFRNEGFKKNQNYFLHRSLGPTPIQVLATGGDCTDKSILLMAMLESIGLDSTLVMLFDNSGKIATHTVVEVRKGQFKAVADPVYDLTFPNPNGGFYGLAELRNNPNILLDRLDQLRQSRGSSNKIAFYKRGSENYQHASPINWNKNYFLKLASEMLGRAGIEARDLRRPHFLDDPKRFVSASLFFVGLAFAAFAFVFRQSDPKVIT